MILSFKIEENQPLKMMKLSRCNRNRISVSEMKILSSAFKTTVQKKRPLNTI